MMNKSQALEFAKASAESALDQWRTWGTVQESVDNYRENLRDTLIDERATQYEPECFEVYDSIIAMSRKDQPTKHVVTVFSRRDAAHVVDRALAYVPDVRVVYVGGTLDAWEIRFDASVICNADELNYIRGGFKSNW